MSQIQVPEKYAADLQDIAAHDCRAVEDVLDEAISSYLSQRFIEHEMTDAQVQRVKLGLGQAERGELISQDEVEAFFDRWEKEATSR